MDQKLALVGSAMTLAVIAVVGFVDSVVDDRAGPALLFAVLALGVLAMARLRMGQTTVSVRRDLASWLDRVSPVTGETPDQLSDRAVSRLRAGFMDLPDGDQ